MHTYRKAKDEPLWTVGHYQQIGYAESSSDHKWIAMKDFGTEADAAAYVSYLNGGAQP